VNGVETLEIPAAPCGALALDVGRWRVGLAGCDPLGIVVTPLPCLRRGSFSDDVSALQGWCRRRSPRLLVVGVPLDASGRETAQAIHCRRYGQRVGRSLALPVAWVNEHATSWSAAQEHGLEGDRSGRLDSEAAALLLEQWLGEPLATAAIPSGPLRSCAPS